MRLSVRALAIAALSLVALWPAGARAHGAGDTVAIPLPPFPPGDGLKAQTAIFDLETRGTKDPALGKVIAGPLAKAKMALQRAHGARTAGDAVHTRQLEALALEWSETAAVLVRTTEAERSSQERSRQADEAASKVERVRALLGETQARKERAAAELERVQHEAKDGQKGAALTEAQRLEAAKKGGPAPKPAPPKTPPPKKDTP